MPDWLAIWKQASASRLGVRVAVSDAVSAKANLYRVRQSSGDLELQGLQIRTSPDDPQGEIWIVKNGPKV